MRAGCDEVVRRLELLAARDGSSVSATAVRELTDVSRRADDLALLRELPYLGVATSATVENIEAERAGR